MPMSWKEPWAVVDEGCGPYYLVLSWWIDFCKWNGHTIPSSLAKSLTDSTNQAVF